MTEGKLLSLSCLCFLICEVGMVVCIPLGYVLGQTNPVMWSTGKEQPELRDPLLFFINCGLKTFGVHILVDFHLGIKQPLFDFEQILECPQKSFS